MSVRRTHARTVVRALMTLVDTRADAVTITLALTAKDVSKKISSQCRLNGKEYFLHNGRDQDFRLGVVFNF